MRNSQLFGLFDLNKWLIISLMKVLRSIIIDTYSVIDGPEEVDLILKSISPGFQLHLVHVSSINILERKSWTSRKCYNWSHSLKPHDKKME